MIPQAGVLPCHFQERRGCEAQWASWFKSWTVSSQGHFFVCFSNMNLPAIFRFESIYELVTLENSSLIFPAGPLSTPVCGALGLSRSVQFFSTKTQIFFWHFFARFMASSSSWSCPGLQRFDPCPWRQGRRRRWSQWRGRSWRPSPGQLTPGKCPGIWLPRRSHFHPPQSLWYTSESEISWRNQKIAHASYSEDWLIEGDKMRSVRKNKRCYKNRYGHNFQNIGSTMNERLFIGYEQTLIGCGSDILTVSFFLTQQFSSYFFWNEGQHQLPVTRLETPLPPFGTHILNRLDMKIHQNIPYQLKKLSKSQLSDPFLGFFWWFLRSGARFT